MVIKQLSLCVHFSCYVVVYSSVVFGVTLDSRVMLSHTILLKSGVQFNLGLF